MAKLDSEKQFAVPKKDKNQKLIPSVTAKVTSPTAKTPARLKPLKIDITWAKHTEIKVFAATQGVSMRATVLAGFELLKKQTP